MNKFYSLTPATAVRATCLGLALLAMTGCNKHQTASLTPAQNHAFDNAPADVKQAWESALAADKANDYENAQKALDGLKQVQLNNDQSQALTAELVSFQNRLYKSAEGGDAAAIKALQDINKGRSRS
jgi:hypothetical protein